MVEKGNKEKKGNEENVEKKEDKNSEDIDWSALDKHWPEQYEKDYGRLFGKK